MAEKSYWDRLLDSVDNVVSTGLPAYLDAEKVTGSEQKDAQYSERAKPSGNVEPISGGVFGVQVTTKNMMIAGGVLVVLAIVLKRVL